MKINTYRLVAHVDKKTYDEFHKKAKNKGLSASLLLRQVASDYLRQRISALNLDDIRRSVKALVPTVAEALCQVVTGPAGQKATMQQKENLTNLLFEKWEKESERKY